MNQRDLLMLILFASDALAQQQQTAQPAPMGGKGDASPFWPWSGPMEGGKGDAMPGFGMDSINPYWGPPYYPGFPHRPGEPY